MINVNSYLNRLSEEMPVFGAEMLVADRRLKERFRRFRVFLNTWRGALTIIGVTLVASYIASSIFASVGLDDDVGYYLLYIIGFLVIPLYASFNSLAVGVMTLTDALDRKIAPEWVSAGISPLDTAKQLIFVRGLRQLFPAIVYSLIFISVFLIMINRESVMDRINALQIVAILIAFLTFQYMFITTATYFAVLVRTTVGRSLFVSGYYIAHIILPILIMALLSDFFMASESESIAGTMLFAIHPYGPLFSSVFLSEGPMFDFDPLATFLISIAVQLGYSYLFFVLATKAFVRKVLE